MAAPDLATLERQVLQAHGRGDRRALARLYLTCAGIKRQSGEDDAAGFFFTQAYVFALDSGDEAIARAAHAQLTMLGRDA